MVENTIPKHVAIIMDGNGRWASEKNLHRSKGHIKGYQNIKPITLHAKKLGIKYLTLFAFSTENWKRSKESNELNQNNINITHLGSNENLPNEMLAKINKSEKLTENNDDFFLSVAFNYGGRNEIINTVNKLLESNIQKINEDIFSSNLMTKNYPDPDIIIRTGGQKRLSNFLLWQSAYSELFFHEKFWPDFSTDDLDMIIKNYSLRERNFGN